MYKIIERFAESDSSNGLMLVDMPTGSGKTYAAIKYIFDACRREENQKRKYIFVTTLKKNLPYEDLKQHFANAGQLDLYNQKVLMIDSNMDGVVDGWSDSVERQIPYEIKKTDEYSKFSKEVKFVKKQREKNTSEYRDLLQPIETNLREKSEPAFRRVVSEYLDKKFPNAEKKLYAIKTDKDWQWLGTLYPAVFTRDRQVLFMSMDKFMSRNTTIVEPSYMFYNWDQLKDAIIFIDEFDAAKETILKNIIINGLRDRIDYIELFKDIYASLHTDTFPTALTTASSRSADKFSSKALEDIVRGLREKADYIFGAYHLQYKHRTAGDIQDSYQNYLFQDHQFHSILNGNNSYITMKNDPNQRINVIGFAKDKPKTEKHNIHVMLGQLRGFITYFQRAVYILAINYMQCKLERPSGDEDIFTMESAVRTVLALFRLSADSIDYLTSQIIMSTHKTKGDIEPGDFDLSFYENGFRYYAFVNDTTHDMQSKIMMYSFQNTPERILLRFCEKSKVIGISATATVPSTVGNFDIEHLRDKLQKKYISLSGDDRRRLLEDFNKSQAGYKDVNIHVELFGEKGAYSDSSWKLVYNNEEIAQMIADEVRRQFSSEDDKNHYHKERYLRIALAYKQFVIHDDIRSFLCVLTKHPKKDDKNLNQTLLFRIFNMIAKDNNSKLAADSNVMYLDGAEYDDKKGLLLNKLSNDEKIFVISVYQTIGAGQNLQYKVPERLKDSLIKINDRPSRGEKDFDAIYLDKPSNLIVNLTTDNLEEQDFVKYLFQMEFLQESSELSSDAAFTNIRKAFKTYLFGQKNQEKWVDVYKKQSVLLMNTRYIIQAIGRICRTNLKSKNIYVFADNRIAESIDQSVAEGRFFNPEFMKLLDEIKKYESAKIETGSLENAASLRAVKVNKYIMNMLNNDWTESKISHWKELRKIVLAHPTASRDEANSSFIIKNFYAELPAKGNRMFFYQDADYNNVSVRFSKDQKHEMVLSEQESKLPDMLKIPGVRDLFERNGWACEFEENDYLMTPTLWNNIYKGALGEVVGKHLFSELINVELEEIEDVERFEVFDYKVPGTSVYIDFKNWHEGTTADKAQTIEKIERKAAQCGCKCVIIANIIASGQWEISDKKGDIRIVSIPYLVMDKGDRVVGNKRAWDIIQECIDEYKDQDK